MRKDLFVLVAVALCIYTLLIGTASAITWTAYGDAWKTNDGVYNVVMWNATGSHSWLATGNATEVEYLVVGGGGGGGGDTVGFPAAGGGAGQFQEGTDLAVSGVETIVVGAGGTAGVANVGGTGGTSSLTNDGATKTSVGGGGGGSNSVGGTGASGGGGASAHAGGTGTAGNNGGAGTSSGPDYGAGGGGGASAVGVDGTATTGGDGGAGTPSDIVETGVNVYYSGGGGGATYGGGTPGAGGSSIGGAGRTGGNGYPAVASRGSGGGGGDYNFNGGEGSGGIVIIRYTPPQAAAFTSNVSSGNSPVGIQFNDTSYWDTIIPNHLSWTIDGGVVYNETAVGGVFTDARNISHIFTTIGTHTVNLSIWNYTVPSWGDNAGANIVVTNNLMNASFTGTPHTLGLSPLTVQFNDTSYWDKIPKDNLSWTIDGGVVYNETAVGGVFTDARNISHVFTTVGTHTVNLSIWNFVTYSYLYQNSTGMNIVVNATVLADFNATPLRAHPNTSIQFVDMSTGSGLTNWTWITGDFNSTGTNKSYVRNFTKIDGYQLLGNYNISLNVTGADGNSTTVKTGYVRINMNNTFTVILRDAETFALITEPDIVKLSVLGVDYTQNTSVGGIVQFELPDGSYDVMAAAIPGLYSSNLASVTMAGTDASGTIYLTSVTSGSKTTWWSPWQVRFQIIDYYGHPLSGINISAHYMTDSFPGGNDWLLTMYGFNPAVANQMANGTLMMQGITDPVGEISFSMHPSLQYCVSALSTTASISGVSQQISIWPKEQEYTILITGTYTQVENLYGNVTAYLNFTEPDKYNVTLGYWYLDNSSRTTKVTFNVTASNGTTIYSEVNIPASPVFGNVTLPNLRGEQYIWGIIADRLGGNITLHQGVTCKGPNGILVDLGLPYDPVYYQLFSGALIMLVGAFASQRNTRFIAILLPILAIIFAWWGWLNVGYLLGVIPFLGLLGAMYYMRGAKDERFGVGSSGSLIISIVFYIIILECVVGYMNTLVIWSSPAMIGPENQFTNVNLGQVKTGLTDFGGYSNPLQDAVMWANMTWTAFRIGFMSVFGAILWINADLIKMFPFIPAGLFTYIVQPIIYILYGLAIFRIIWKPMPDEAKA